MSTLTYTLIGYKPNGEEGVAESKFQIMIDRDVSAIVHAYADMMIEDLKQDDSDPTWVTTLLVDGDAAGGYTVKRIADAASELVERRARDGEFA